MIKGSFRQHQISKHLHYRGSRKRRKREKGTVVDMHTLGLYLNWPLDFKSLLHMSTWMFHTHSKLVMSSFEITWTQTNFCSWISYFNNTIQSPKQKYESHFLSLFTRPLKTLHRCPFRHHIFHVLIIFFSRLWRSPWLVLSSRPSPFVPPTTTRLSEQMVPFSRTQIWSFLFLPYYS